MEGAEGSRSDLRDRWQRDSGGGGEKSAPSRVPPGQFVKHKRRAAQEDASSFGTEEPAAWGCHRLRRGPSPDKANVEGGDGVEVWKRGVSDIHRPSLRRRISESNIPAGRVWAKGYPSEIRLCADGTKSHHTGSAPFPHLPRCFPPPCSHVPRPMPAPPSSLPLTRPHASPAWIASLPAELSPTTQGVLLPSPALSHVNISSPSQK